MMEINKRVLDVGNCGPDHHAICAMFAANFPNVEVVQSQGPEDTLQLLHESSVDLVLINRKLDQDYSEGTEVLKLIKAEPKFASVPVMLVTNFEEYQQAAVEMGAIRGFGKLELDSPSTHQCLASTLGNVG